MDPPVILTAAELFEKHDLEFRTITTLLHKLGSHDRVTLDNFHISQQHRPCLKLLAALSPLLVRDHEVLAIMLKRSTHGTTLFVGSGADEDCDDESTSSGLSSWSSSSSHENLITRNPRFNDPVCPVGLLVSPSVNVPSDVLGFILRNWHLSFELHVQAFANLLNESLNDPNNVEARGALDIYSVFQSVPKIYRRFKHSLRLQELKCIQLPDNVTLVPSSSDRYRISGILTANKGGAQLNHLLYGFLHHNPLDPRHWLPQFHNFFLWFLDIVDTQLKLLSTLRTSLVAPPELPESMIDLTLSNLKVMQFFSWESEFFESYIWVAFGAGVWGMPGVAASVAEPGEEAPGAAFPDENKQRSKPEEDESGLDISTEFETGEETASAAQPPPAIHPCIAELRLISSNIQNIRTLLRRAPKSRFRFEVIQYAPAGKSLKPWRDLISELLPNKEVQAKVLQALRDTPGKQFNVFRPDGPDLVFKGQVHCEALLGCLYSLTKRGEDVSWTGIPKSVLDAIRTCYSVLAPSKRCCPVCAVTISLLSQETVEAGGPRINALSKHSVTFPCAFPVGLPCQIREKLLLRYRAELSERLTSMLQLDSKLSGRSPQSDILSLDGKSEDTPGEDELAFLGLLKAGWARLSQDERRERWEAAREKLPRAHLLAWWAKMSEDTKVGLVPPLEHEEMAKPDMMTDW